MSDVLLYTQVQIIYNGIEALHLLTHAIQCHSHLQWPLLITCRPIVFYIQMFISD